MTTDLSDDFHGGCSDARSLCVCVFRLFALTDHYIKTQLQTAVTWFLIDYQYVFLPDLLGKDRCRLLCRAAALSVWAAQFNVGTGKECGRHSTLISRMSPAWYGEGRKRVTGKSEKGRSQSNFSETKRKYFSCQDLTKLHPWDEGFITP